MTFRFETIERIASIRCEILSKAAESLASALDDVKSPEARQHAKEARGAAKMARAWKRELMKIHISKQRRKP